MCTNVNSYSSAFDCRSVLSLHDCLYDCEQLQCFACTTFNSHSALCARLSTVTVLLVHNYRQSQCFVRTTININDDNNNGWLLNSSNLSVKRIQCTSTRHSLRYAHLHKHNVYTRARTHARMHAHARTHTHTHTPVSYTHLTLPTKLSV